MGTAEESEDELMAEHDRGSGLRAKDYIMSPNDIDRNEICPAARVYVGPREKPHPGMWHGIFIHRFLEYVLTRGHTAALAYVKSKRNKGVINVCSRIDVSKIPSHAIPEMKIMVDMEARTAEASEREFAEADKNILGTADIVYRNEGAAVEWNVGDYKSGTEHGVQPEGNAQLLTLAVGIQLMQNVERVRGAIIDVAKTGDLIWHPTIYTEKHLKTHMARMRRAHLLTLETRDELRHEKIEPDVIPGPHCRGCRASTVCVGGQLVR
jgi:hypothetical protein